MLIVFRDKKLEGLAADYARCQRSMGSRRARVFIARLNALHDARTLEDLRYLPGRFHELSGDRKGQWSCDLDHPYRLIFTPLRSSSSKRESQPLADTTLTLVEIIEVVDYH